MAVIVTTAKILANNEILFILGEHILMAKCFAYFHNFSFLTCPSIHCLRYVFFTAAKGTHVTVTIVTCMLTPVLTGAERGPWLHPGMSQEQI